MPRKAGDTRGRSQLLELMPKSRGLSPLDSRAILPGKGLGMSGCLESGTEQTASLVTLTALLGRTDSPSSSSIASYSRDRVEARSWDRRTRTWSVLVGLRSSTGSDEQFGKNSEH